MSDRFFTPQPLGPGLVTLDGDEAKHLGTVRRFGPGDRVTLFNGDGNEYPAVITDAGKRSVALTIDAVESPNRERPFPLTVASAIPKGDRGDFLIEKLVELGVTTFIPLITERSVVIPKPDKREKWERAVIEASKQCGRNVLMSVDDPSPWDGLLQRFTNVTNRFVLHTGPDLAPLTRLNEAALIAIGPEGGLTESELSAAVKAGWQLRSLGPRTLRMETAAISAAAVM
jgi:16S rRNA (uracil1498-N3)-methyltransferase